MQKVIAKQFSETLSFDEKFNIISKYRSVIVRDNKVVAYSPCKSMNYNIFKNLYLKEILQTLNQLVYLYLLTLYLPKQFL